MENGKIFFLTKDLASQFLPRWRPLKHVWGKDADFLLKYLQVKKNYKYSSERTYKTNVAYKYLIVVNFIKTKNIQIKIST